MLWRKQFLLPSEQQSRGDSVAPGYNRILSRALGNSGFEVVELGALTPVNEFIEAAIESKADAILVSSLYGHGELDCVGFYDLCVEAGIKDVILYIGGYLTVGEQPWEMIEKRYKEMGFHRVFPPGTRPNDIVGILDADILAKKNIQEP